MGQYGFGLKPCHLCIAQRVPFALVILLAAVGLFKAPWQRALIALIAALFIINAGIAAYHAAVEKNWVPGPESCTMSEANASQSTDDFLKRIQAAPVVACDAPQWEWSGLTMASLNMVWSLFLSLAVFAALQHIRRREKAHA